MLGRVLETVAAIRDASIRFISKGVPEVLVDREITPTEIVWCTMSF